MPQPPKQDFAAAASPGYQIRAAHRAFDRLLQFLLAEHDLQVGYWYLLRILWEGDGMTQRELAEAASLTESTMVTTLNAMEAADLVERRRSTSDRRKIMIYLTPRSTEIRGQLLPIAGEINEIASLGIAERDIATMLSVLGRMRKNLRAHLAEALKASG